MRAPGADASSYSIHPSAWKMNSYSFGGCGAPRHSLSDGPLRPEDVAESGARDTSSASASNDPQEGHGGAEESSSSGLVRSLAAIVGRKLGVSDRLVRVRAPLDLQDEVLVYNPSTKTSTTFSPYSRNCETFSFVTSFTSTGMCFGTDLPSMIFMAFWTPREPILSGCWATVAFIFSLWIAFRASSVPSKPTIFT